MRRPTTVTAVTIALAAVAVPAAYAAWQVAASGSGSATARSLAAVTNPAAAASAANVTITWTNGDNPTGTTHQVVRNSSTSTTLACTSSPCLDKGAPAGTYNYTIRPKLHSWEGASTSTAAVVVTNTQPATQLSMSADPSTMTAGTPTTVTLTARTAAGTTDPTYTGAKTVTWGGAAFSNSPGGTGPTAPSSVTFTNGIATATVTLTKAGTGALTAEISGLSAGSTSMTVNAATAAQLAFVDCSKPASNSTCSGQPIAIGNNTSMTAAVELRDVYANPVAAGAGGRSITVTRTSTDTYFGPGTVTLTVAAGATKSGTVTLTTGSGQVNSAGVFDATSSGLTKGTLQVIR